MSAPFNISPLEVPQRGTGISLSELGKVFHRAQYSGVGGPDVIQNGSGNFIPDPPTERILAIVGEKSSASPYKYTWYRAYIDENQTVTKLTPDNPDGYRISQDFYNYLIDPHDKITEGSKVWISFDAKNGYWVANTEASLTNTPTQYSAFITSGIVLAAGATHTQTLFTITSAAVYILTGRITFDISSSSSKQLALITIKVDGTTVSQHWQTFPANNDIVQTIPIAVQFETTDSSAAVVIEVLAGGGNTVSITIQDLGFPTTLKVQAVNI